MPEIQPGHPPPVAGVTQSQLDAHLAEYAALTMRTTYWLTLQYAIYGIAGAYVGFAVQARNSIPIGSLVWASLLVLQLLGWGMLQTQYEIFINVDYLENHLKPKVAQLVGDGCCWGFEPFLAKRRATGFTRFEFRYGLLGFFVLLVGVAGWLISWAITQTHWTLADTLWAGANLYVGVIVVGKVAQNSRIQKQMVCPNLLNTATPPAEQGECKSAR